MITLGYCCNSLGSHKTNFKTMTLKKLKTLNFDPIIDSQSWRYVDDWYNDYSCLELGAKELLKIYVHNIKELTAVLKYNIANNVKLYRISSNLFPFWSYSSGLLPIKSQALKSYAIPAKTFNSMVKNRFVDSMGNVDLELQKTVKAYLENGGRLTMHPPEFVSLGSSDSKVINASIAELSAHAKFLDWIGAPADYTCPLNIHVSRGAQDPVLTSTAVDQQLVKLIKIAPTAFKRLVFETEDKGCWTWQKLEKHFPGVPITFDVHHWEINNEGETLLEAVQACTRTWNRTINMYRGEIEFLIDHPYAYTSLADPRLSDFSYWRKVRGIPLMHISEGRNGRLDRSHHDYVETIQDEILFAPLDISLEVEAKAKDLAYFALRDKYKNLVA